MYYIKELLVRIYTQSKMYLFFFQSIFCTLNKLRSNILLFFKEERGLFSYLLFNFYIYIVYIVLII